MPRKVLSLILVLALVLGLAGCFSPEEGNSSQVKPPVKVADKIKPEARDGAQKEPGDAGEKSSEKQNTAGEAEKDREKTGILPSKEALPEARDKGSDLKKARLVITSGFGRQVIMDREVWFAPGSTVMEILKAYCQVDTAYGGSFVNGINGVASRKGFPPQDWFYYVNGICADCGAADKKVQTEDVIWWDYHPWKAGIANTAVIGTYPEPFLKGYNGTSRGVKIVFSSSLRQEAEKLKSSLQAEGVKEVELKELEKAEVYPRLTPLLVVAEWEELEKIDYFQRLNQAYGRHGMGFCFEETGLYLLDYAGKKARLCRDHAAVIGAVGDGLGDTNPLWLITGTDLESVRKGIELLAAPEKIRYMYSAALVDGEVIRLPLE